MNQSEQGKLNNEDLKQLVIKALMIGFATMLPVIADQLRVANFGQYQPVVTVVIFLLAYLGQRLNQGR